ncbi:MAG: hypothetical protein AAF787_10655, partial [Chloroflexota bacterium]
MSLKNVLYMFLFSFLTVSSGHALDDPLLFPGKVAYTAQGGIHVLDLQTMKTERFVREDRQTLIRPDWHHKGRLLATDQPLLILDTFNGKRELLGIFGLFPAW